jgi:hypothetical protein
MIIDFKVGVIAAAFGKSLTDLFLFPPEIFSCLRAASSLVFCY